MPESVNIARCPKHGLHGARTQCFICDGEVEQVAMVTLAAHDAILDALSGAISLAEHLLASAVGIDGWRFRQEIEGLRAIRNGVPLPDPPVPHRVETYKPRPRPAGEHERLIHEAVGRSAR